MATNEEDYPALADELDARADANLAIGRAYPHLAGRAARSHNLKRRAADAIRRLAAERDALAETVERQGRTIAGLIAPPRAPPASRGPGPGVLSKGDGLASPQSSKTRGAERPRDLTPGRGLDTPARGFFVAVV